jgi:GNAT superfamily N-acetyltransferase
MTVTIEQLTEREFFAWYPLFVDYAASAGLQITDEQVMRVWTALQTPGAHAAVAHDETGAVVGFVHAVPFERLLQGDEGLLIEDLFVAPASRNHGVATALVEHLRSAAESSQRAQLRWAVQGDDVAAKALQEKFADAAGGWVLQTLPVG